MSGRMLAVLGCLFGALAWPYAVSALSYAAMTPLDRATALAWCGGPAYSLALAGHCAACWIGSAGFAAAAAWLRLGENSASESVKG